MFGSQKRKRQAHARLVAEARRTQPARQIGPAQAASTLWLDPKVSIDSSRISRSAK